MTEKMQEVTALGDCSIAEELNTMFPTSDAKDQWCGDDPLEPRPSISNLELQEAQLKTMAGPQLMKKRGRKRKCPDEKTSKRSKSVQLRNVDNDMEGQTVPVLGCVTTSTLELPTEDAVVDAVNKASTDGDAEAVDSTSSAVQIECMDDAVVNSKKENSNASSTITSETNEDGKKSVEETKAPVKASRKPRQPKNNSNAAPRRKETKAEADMRRLLKHQAEFAQRKNAQRFEQQLIEIQNAKKYPENESEHDKQLRKLNEETQLLQNLADMVKSLTEGEQDHDKCLASIKAMADYLTPEMLLKYPIIVVLFESVRRYRGNEEVQKTGKYVYSLFEAMLPRRGFEDFVYGFNREVKLHQERLQGQEKHAKKVFEKFRKAKADQTEPTFTLENWTDLQRERYAVWDQFFQSYNKPEDETLDGKKKKSAKDDLVTDKISADDVKDEDLPKKKLGRSKKIGGIMKVNRDYCKEEPKIEEKNIKKLKYEDEDEKPDLKPTSPDLKLVKVKEENDEKPLIKTEVVSDSQSKEDKKRKRKKEGGRKRKEKNQDGVKQKHRSKKGAEEISSNN